jgi:hypothetical protein
MAANVIKLLEKYLLHSAGGCTVQKIHFEKVERQRGVVGGEHY